MYIADGKEKGTQTLVWSGYFISCNSEIKNGVIVAAGGAFI